ncbi:MAG: HD domain-containing protein [Ectobacillus sp.]
MEGKELDILNKAVETAVIAHESQKRKGSSIPYIVHPVTVAMLLMQADCSRDIVIAGLLHDTVEDTSMSYETIQNQFGANVARLVQECSEHDKAKEWEERKQHMINQIEHISEEACMIMCADKLHNICSVATNLQTSGDMVGNRFKRGKDKQEWYYRSVVEALGKRIPEFSLYVLLKREVEGLFE